MKLITALLIGVCLCICCLPSMAAPKLESYKWRNVEVNGGGFVPGIIFHPKERGLVYARTDIGGAYRWDTVSKRWVPLTDHFGAADWNLYGVESIAPDPSDANRAYAAVGTYTNDWAGNGALLRSSDRGKTWLKANLPFKNGGNEDGRGMGERLIVHPRDSKVLFFGTRRNGLWKSVNFGASWAKVVSFPAQDNENGIGVSFLTFDAKGVLWAGVASHGESLFRSADGGVTWSAVEGAPQGYFPHHGIFAADGTFYVTYSDGPGPNGVTGGAVWKRSAAGVWSEISPVRPSDKNRFGFAGLGVDARNPRVLMVATLDRWALGDDIFRSTDGGVTWKSVKEHSTRDAAAAPYLNWKRKEADLGHWIADVEIDPFDSGHVLYVTGATIWGSDDVNALDKDAISHWDVRAGGIEETSVSSLISPPIGPHLISGMRDIGGFVHEDLTVSPRQGAMDNPHTSRNEGLDFAAQKPGVIVRSGDGRGGISLDSGASWSEFGKTGENMDQGTVAVSADGRIVVWSANDGANKEGGAYMSNDRGVTWTKCLGLPAKPTVISDRFEGATFYCLDGVARRLLISTDGGVSFAPRGGEIPAGFNGLWAAPHGSGNLWLTGPEGLMRSTDGGMNWTKINSVAGSETVGFGKGAPGATYEAIYLVGTVGGTRGIFRSDDMGANWVRINDDRHQWGWVGKCITGDPRVYRRVYLATNGRGIVWGEPSP
jgi:hypothetical protein